ncbi:MAG: 2-hydroxychromene-2-carboxylate isomerase [Burkholderiaceae bacterium]|nr:2-hydroxychromene-2-carboxylate isomerase [Burkholderiaceae bacterium]
MKRIDFYLDFVSPYAYLAFEKMPRVLQGLSYEVTYRPIFLAALLKHDGQLEALDIAGKREWIYRHVFWLARKLEIPLQVPPTHPFNSLPLLRLAWANAQEGSPNRYVCETVFREVWTTGADATGPGQLQMLQARLTPAQVADSGVAKLKLREQTGAAMDAGIFGVPSFRVDGRVFWGLESLGMLREYLIDQQALAADWLLAADVAARGAARKPGRAAP